MSSPNARTFVAISTAMLGSMMFGIDCSNFGTTSGFDSFLDHWCTPNFGGPSQCTHEASANNSGWYIFVTLCQVLIPLGGCFGGITIGRPIADNSGRRPCVSAGCALTFLGSLISAFFCHGSIWMFYASRFITGYGVGVAAYALPMYNSEIATASIRGATGGFFQMFLVVGQLIAAFVVNGLKTSEAESNWRIGMFLPGIAGGIVMFLVWLVPESPRFAMQKHGHDACLSILRKVRSGDVDQEAHAIQNAIQTSQPVAVMELLSNPSSRRRLLVALGLQVCQQLTGINILLGFWDLYCTKVGIGNPTGTNVIFTIVQLVGVVSSVALIDSRFGARKRLLLTSTVFMIPALLLIGLTARQGWSADVAKWATFAYGFGYQLAWGMVGWVYPSEIFSMSEKATAISIVVFFNYAANVGVYFGGPQLVKWSIEYSAFVLVGFNVMNVAFIVLAMKETKGKLLEDIPALFGGVATEPKKIEQ